MCPLLFLASFPQQKAFDFQFYCCIYEWIIIFHCHVIAHHVSVQLLTFNEQIVSSICILLIEHLQTFLNMYFDWNMHTLRLDIYLDVDLLGNRVGRAFVSTVKILKNIWVSLHCYQWSWRVHLFFILINT